jgi:CBS domain containing-hemolysin-like protein
MPGLPALAASALLALAPAAHASFLPPELMDTAATYLAWFVLIVMPIGGVALFWMVHVLPEKIAEKRHHPQAHAIQVLCLLSLVFGGLLWPIAWLWAYTKPTSYRLAYGTDKSDEYFEQMAERAEKGEIRGHALHAALDELDGVAARNALSAELRVARARLAAVAAAADTPAGTAVQGGA